MDIVTHPISHTDMAIQLSGEMDALGTKQIQAQLEEIAEIRRSVSLVMDLGEVTFLDSSGVGALVFLFKRLRAEGGELTLVNVHGQPYELLHLLRVNNAIPINPDNESTMNSVFG